MTIEQLIEDYWRRIETCNEGIRQGISLEVNRRLEIKRGCYRTFIAELEQLNQRK